MEDEATNSELEDGEIVRRVLAGEEELFETRVPVGQEAFGADFAQRAVVALEQRELGLGAPDVAGEDHVRHPTGCVSKIVYGSKPGEVTRLTPWKSRGGPVSR